MASIPEGSLLRNHQLIANPVTRLYIAEDIIAMRRFNGRRLRDIEVVLLLHFVLHCGIMLEDGWEISREELARRYGKAPSTLSSAIKTLLSGELIVRVRVQRGQARYSLGPAFEEPVRPLENERSNGVKTSRKREVLTPHPNKKDFLDISTAHDARAGEAGTKKQLDTLRQMLEERALGWDDIVEKWDFIAGVVGGPPTQLNDLPRQDVSAVFHFVKAQGRRGDHGGGRDEGERRPRKRAADSIAAQESMKEATRLWEEGWTP